MKPSELIPLIITGTVCLMVLGIVAASLITGEKMSEDGVKILGDIVLALVAIISFYMGRKSKG